jgi:hypothetical protein
MVVGNSLDSVYQWPVAVTCYSEMSLRGTSLLERVVWGYPNLGGYPRLPIVDVPLNSE